MRTFRNRLIPVVLFLALPMVGGCDAPPQPGAGAVAPSAVPSVNAYFPLATGNKWVYRCKDESGASLGKTVVIVSRRQAGDRSYYEARLAVAGDARPLTFFYSVKSDGAVYKSMQAGAGAEEMLISRAPSPGARVGDNTVAAIVSVAVPVAKGLEAVQVENFSIEAPDVSAAKRMEWLAKYYARGYGLVAEADGLGGECVLAEAVINKTDGQGSQ